ncbi:hypothetical protein DFJ74DRAFT_743282 [Hyaloraphidium curvatum]|nr:hypothetical protein DFJ74DRAFT_743282 [Hyaloraphidium curvatum]
MSAPPSPAYDPYAPPPGDVVAPEGPPPTYESAPLRSDWLAALALPTPPSDPDSEELKSLLIAEFKEEHSMKDIFQNTGARFGRYGIELRPPVVLLACRVAAVREKRNVVAQEEPWNGYPVPPAQPPPVWSMPVQQPALSDTNRTGQVRVRMPQTERQMRCAGCGQAGRVACSTCNGAGRRECEVCWGSGYVTHHRHRHSYTNMCYNCTGTGVVSCEPCGNSGSVVCPRCRGSLFTVAYGVVEVGWELCMYTGLDAVDTSGSKLDPADLSAEVAAGTVPAPTPAAQNRLKGQLKGDLLKELLPSGGKPVFDVLVDSFRNPIPGFTPLRCDLPPSTDSLLSDLRASAHAEPSLPPGEQWKVGTKVVSVRTSVRAALAVRADAIKGRGAEDGMFTKGARWKGMYWVVGGGKAVEAFSEM